VRNDKEWLLDILDAIKKIEKYNSDKYLTFLKRTIYCAPSGLLLIFSFSRAVGPGYNTLPRWGCKK